MMRVALGLALMLSLGGCCHFRARDVQLIGVTDEESRWAESAAQQWCDKSGFCPRIVESSTNTIGLTTDPALLPSPEGREAVGECWETVDMYTGIAEVHIWIRDDRDKFEPLEWLPRFRRILLHELGHVGGCPDLPNAGSVMDAEVNDTEDLRQRDIDCLQVD